MAHMGGGPVMQQQQQQQEHQERRAAQQHMLQQYVFQNIAQNATQVDALSWQANFPINIRVLKAMTL